MPNDHSCSKEGFVFDFNEDAWVCRKCGYRYVSGKVVDEGIVQYWKPFYMTILIPVVYGEYWWPWKMYRGVRK